MRYVEWREIKNRGEVGLGGVRCRISVVRAGYVGLCGSGRGGMVKLGLWLRPFCFGSF